MLFRRGELLWRESGARRTDEMAAILDRYIG